ncbi:anthranilate synthase component I [Ornithinibacillus sp. 4-3]|uniref:Anthranilate synthase component 1 n=1 Tax=Ornithinibacillus sp. 4-3 TaxID=3231488 RepID=A0AB39HTD8_9BACI
MIKTLSYKSKNMNADTLTPIGIFQNMDGKKKFLLESSYQYEAKGKFSFIGSNPYQEIIGSGNTTTVIDCQTKEEQVIDQNILQYVKENLPNIEYELPLAFTGGAVGYIGYDAIRAFAPIGEELPDELEMPDVHFMVFENLIVYEHGNDTVHIIATNLHNEKEEQLDERINQIEKSLYQHKPEQENEAEALEFNFKPDIPKEKFIEKVKAAQKYIHSGETLQIVISQRMKADFQGDPFRFYRKLRRANPSPYMFYIDFEDYLIIGASPESLVQATGKHVVTNPIAGTKPRANSEAEEKQVIKDFLKDPKELSEHEMLVDLSKSDFSKVCDPETITVPTYMKIEKYQHVIHIVSEVQGELKEDATSIDALIACLPAGTVSGAPRLRAMQIINEIEEKKRGFYSGGIGYIGFNRDLNMALAIRTMAVKDGSAYLQAGAGIVAESNPEMEYYETMHKSRSLMEVTK